MTKTIDYSIDQLKQEVRYLVERGLVDRKQPICVLCQFVPPRDWVCVECELEKNDYLLRDHICDLLEKEQWEED